MNILPWRDRYSPTALRTELDSLLGRFPFSETESRLPEIFARRAMPPVNIAETEKNWSVAVELPGLNEKDIHVELMGQQLVISGERKWEEENKNKEYRSVERETGRRFRITREADREQRRRRDRDDHGQGGTGDADECNPGEPEVQSLAASHPDRAEYRRVGRVDERLP